ncbi:unnamed protein product [Nesidiocoris tenuis]|uniref:Uncharacterized protein n=1 Tax=Nesidiocoris tenuis TaxID=355587 RepID=A0A6H5H1Q7_9HEMI|nr:unnamed protein product [Nesidiocoris tenuis]
MASQIDEQFGWNKKRDWKCRHVQEIGDIVVVQSSSLVPEARHLKFGTRYSSDGFHFTKTDFQEKFEKATHLDDFRQNFGSRIYMTCYRITGLAKCTHHNFHHPETGSLPEQVSVCPCVRLWSFTKMAIAPSITENYSQPFFQRNRDILKSPKNMLEKKSHQIPLNRQEKNSFGLSKRVCPGKIDWESMVKVLDEQKRPDLRPSRGERRETVADLGKSSKTEFEAVPFEPTDAVFGNLEEKISSVFASEFTFLDDNDEIEIGEELDDLVSAEMSKFSRSGTFIPGAEINWMLKKFTPIGQTLPISPSDAQYRSLSDSRAVSVAPSGGLCRSLGRPLSLPRALPWRLPSRSLGRSHGGCLVAHKDVL